MSEENVELVRWAVESFSEAGVDSLVEGSAFSPDLVFDATQSGIPGAGVYQGFEKVRGFFERDWFGAFPFAEWEMRLGEAIDHGDQVVALTRQHGRGAGSGVEATLELWQVVTLRDGGIVRWDVYPDRGRALEAAGLTE